MLSGAADLELEELTLMHPHLALNIRREADFPLMVNFGKHAQ
jgi:hypothetical protein